MITSGISIPTEDLSAAEEFDRKADDFAALAEAASTAEDCIRYRDLEQTWRLRAEAERVYETSRFVQNSAGVRDVYYV